MQVKYQISFTDYENALLSISTNVPTYKGTKFRYSLALAILFSLLSPVSSYILKFILAILFFLLLYLYLLDQLILFYLKAVLNEKSKKKESVFPKEITLDINEKRFIYVSKTEKNEEEFSVSWINVTTVVEVEEIYVLYTSVLSTFYIFKKELESLEDSALFNQEIKEILGEYYISIQRL